MKTTTTSTTAAAAAMKHTYHYIQIIKGKISVNTVKNNKMASNRKYELYLETPFKRSQIVIYKALIAIRYVI